MDKPKTYLEILAFLRDGGRTRKALRNAPDAPLYVFDNDPDADEYYVLIPGQTAGKRDDTQG